MMGWLRKILAWIGFGKAEEAEPVKSYDVDDKLVRDIRQPPRGGIRRSDIGMRKLTRHRAGRQHEMRMGFDPSKRMVDIEDDDERPRRRKKRRWVG